MKRENEIKSLFGSQIKKEILVVTSNEPGKYMFRGKIYNEEGLEILKQGYERCVIFTPKKYV
ncbi:MAG TPA: hypothetical protein VIK14_16360 [Ignavibacteria bacterium]